MNKLLDAAETAASGRQQQWLWCRKPKAAVALATMATATLHSVTIERQCGTTTRIKKNKRKKSIVNMDMNLDRRDANKIETTHFLLGLSSVSICLSVCCSASEPITSIYIEREEKKKERHKRERRTLRCSSHS
jgi:hypothetical protein